MSWPPGSLNPVFQPVLNLLETSVEQQRLSRIEQAIRRAYTMADPSRGNMLKTRNLIHNTETIPYGQQAYKVMSNRGN